MFRDECLRLAECLQLHGIIRNPFSAKPLSHFVDLSLEEKLAAYENLALYNSVCSEVLGSGGNLYDSPTLIWRMLQRLRFHACDDLFTTITSNHVVEIYTKNNTQIFRNFRFFEICSYSIEELYAIPWWKLYRRDENITRAIFAQSITLFESAERRSIVPNVPTHQLEEISSGKRFRMSLDLDFLSPLFHEGEVAAICAIERARDLFAGQELQLSNFDML